MVVATDGCDAADESPVAAAPQAGVYEDAEPCVWDLDTASLKFESGDMDWASVLNDEVRTCTPSLTRGTLNSAPVPWRSSIFLVPTVCAKPVSEPHLPALPYKAPFRDMG